MPFYHGVKDKYVYMQMQRLFTEMDDSDRLLQLQIGLDATGTGSAFVARNLVSAAASCCSITSNIKGTYLIHLANLECQQSLCPKEISFHSSFAQTM